MVNYHLGGKQHRMFFKTEADAKRFTKAKSIDVEKNGATWLEIPPSERAEIMIARQRASAGGYSLSEALDSFEKSRVTTSTTVTLADATKACLESKRRQNCRVRYINQIQSNFRKFEAAFGSELITDLTSSKLEDWLNSHGWAPATRKSYRVDLQTLFSFAIGRGWIEKNPATAIPVPMIDDKPPGILTVEECSRLMKACKENDPAMCGFFALALFAGIRPSQLLRMTAENVDLESKVARAAGWQTKSRQNRIVELSDNCIAWCKVGLEVPPVNWRKRSDRIRILSKVENWTHDCLRHSFCSYHLAMNGSAEKTALQMGHHSTQMIFQHYRELVKKTEAEKFWKITP